MFIFDFAPPKRMGLRSHMRLSGVLVKSILDYVTRRNYQESNPARKKEKKNT